MLAWLSTFKTVAGLVAAVVALLRWVGDVMQTERDRAAGRVEQQAKEAQEAQRVQENISEAAAKTVTEDDAIERMKKGEA